MRIDLQPRGAPGNAARRVDVTGDAAAVLTARTHWRHAAPQPRDAELEVDPLAGEDEPWADEDFLWTPDEEDYVRFFRTLWIALVLCLLFWLAVAVGGAELLGLAAA
jgi:hypothetical protein